MEKVAWDCGDFDAVFLPDWIKDGFPLGIKHPIENAGIFPSTESVSEAVLESKLDGHLMGDADGSSTNYVSFDDSIEHAQALLDQLVAEGRSESFFDWGDVVKLFGPEATLTRLACVVMVKESGELKYRLVVDSRRSGVNGLTDVAGAIRRLLVKNDGWAHQQLELISVDFRDAFHTCPLRQDECQFVVCKDSYGSFHVSRVVQFGLSPGPLLWARLASAAMRLGLSAIEASVCTYVDDPLIAVMGRSKAERTKMFFVYVAVWLSLGVQISWKKADRGNLIHWIGSELQLHDGGDLTVRLTDSKRQKFLETMEEI